MSRKLLAATWRMTGAAATGQGIALLLAPFITRVYDPSDFGVFSLYIAITVVDVLLCLGYERTIALPSENKDAYSLFTISVVLGVVFGLLALLAVAVFRQNIAEAFGVPVLAPLLWLLPVTMFFVAGYQALTNWALRELNFKLLAKARIALYACSATIQLSIGWLGIGAAGLIVGHLAGYVIATALLLRPVMLASRQLRLPTMHEAMSLARRFRDFPIFGATAAFLNLAGLQVPVLGIAALYGPEVAGWYGFAQRVFGAPLSLLAMSVGQSLKANLAEAVRNGEPALFMRDQLSVVVLLQSALSVILIGFILFAPQLFGLVFGENWRVSGVYLQYLAPFFLLQFIVTPLQVIFDVLEKQRLHFMRETLRVLLLAGVFAFASIASLDELGAIALISATGFIVYLASGALVLAACRQAVLAAPRRGGNE